MSGLHVVLGTGSLGYAVAVQATARGHTVKMFSRSGKGEAPPGVSVGKADIEDPSSAAEAAKGAQVVHLCAAPPYTDWPAHYPAMQKGVIEAAARNNARLVTAENVYPYGRVSGPMTEETPIAPCSKKGELRAKLNQELLEANRAGKVKVALARGPDYFGPRATASTVYGDQVFGRIVAGKGANVFGDLDKKHTFIYVDDFARGMVLLGEKEEATGQVWHMPCPPALTQRELLSMLFRLLNKPMKAASMPGAILAMLSWFMPIMRELKEMEYQWRMDYDFRCDKFTRTFGADVVSHEKALTQTLDWFTQQAKK
jgi:nucleoside-diphosphate-sugar epimerase